MAVRSQYIHFPIVMYSLAILFTRIISMAYCITLVLQIKRNLDVCSIFSRGFSVVGQPPCKLICDNAKALQKHTNDSIILRICYISRICIFFRKESLSKAVQMSSQVSSNFSPKFLSWANLLVNQFWTMRKKKLLLPSSYAYIIPTEYVFYFRKQSL